MTYNEIIQQVGKKITEHVYYVKNGTTTYVNDDNIERTKLFLKSDLLGTAIKGCELELREQLDGYVYIQIVASYGEYSDTKTYGPYMIIEEEYDANKKQYKYSLYDYLVASMVDYEAVAITYPTTVYNYFSALCTKLGYTNNIASLPNGSRVLTSDLYENIGYTYRDVLDDIAVANGVLFYIDNNEIKIASLGAHTISIDDDILRNQNIEFGKHYGPINSIVVSRGGESDNVYIKDDASIAQYGLCEFKIVDNQLMRENDRDEYLNALSTQLFGIEYDIYDTELVGYGEINLLDEVNFTTGENTYSSYLFNDEITITSGYKQAIYNEMPKETETDYKSADTTDKRINQAYIITRKNEAEIEALASKVVDISKTLIGVGSVTLENAYEGIIHRIAIKGSMKLVYPSNQQYPKSTLYPLNSILLVDNVEYDTKIDQLNYLSSTVYDEYICEDGKAWIERRVGVNSDGTLYELSTPTIEDLGELYIEVKHNSIIKMLGFNNLTYTVTYLLENNYTSTFANQVEVKSGLELLGDRIEASVSSVADTQGNITAASIILAVNQDESVAEINSDKINLNGAVTANENFKILQDGSMVTKNGTFNGIINGGKIEITGNYTEEEPYINVLSPNNTEESPVGTSIWGAGITAYDYSQESVAVIRTESDDGYAELYGSVVNAFGFNNVSLASKKKDIEKYTENALELIKNIDIYKYLYKGEISEKKHIGVVIGDDYNYSEEITTKDNTEIDLYSFISVCCKAIQEQQKEIEELREEIKKCKK